MNQSFFFPILDFLHAISVSSGRGEKRRDFQIGVVRVLDFISVRLDMSIW